MLPASIHECELRGANTGGGNLAVIIDSCCCLEDKLMRSEEQPLAKAVEQRMPILAEQCV